MNANGNYCQINICIDNFIRFNKNTYIYFIFFIFIVFMDKKKIFKSSFNVVYLSKFQLEIVTFLTNHSNHSKFINLIGISFFIQFYLQTNNNKIPDIYTFHFNNYSHIPYNIYILCILYQRIACRIHNNHCHHLLLDILLQNHNHSVIIVNLM